jgi:nucleotide-binding universal stress UspA family protein
MSEHGQQRIVVGVDRSEAALAALEWAAAEARLRKASLHVVHAWEPVTYHASYAVVDDWPTGEQERLRAGADLAAVMRAVFGAEGAANVTQELAEGVAERVVVARSAGADLLVLGADTPERLAGRPAGPVIRACMSHAQCPVVIIGAGPSHPLSAPEPAFS